MILIIIMSVSRPLPTIWTSVSCQRICLGRHVNPLGLHLGNVAGRKKYSCNEICMLYSAGKYVTTAELLSMICLL